MNAKVAGESTPAIEKTEIQAKPRVRDRIFETACDLFYQHGIRAVGIDAIAQEAGTNKMSFYRAFPSKDELVAEYLRDQQREFIQWWDETVAAHQGDPLAQLYALFDVYLEASCKKAECHSRYKTSRGCPLDNAAVEIPEDNAQLNAIVQEHSAQFRCRLRTLAREIGARDPETLGDALMLLMKGGYYTRLIFPHNTGPVSAIAKAARTLIQAHLQH